MITDAQHPQQQQQQQASPAALEAMNREKVASILTYLDGVDSESCCSSIAPSQFRPPTSHTHSQQQHQQQQQQQQQQFSDPMMMEAEHFSPDPMPHHQQQQQSQQQPRAASGSLSQQRFAAASVSRSPMRSLHPADSASCVGGVEGSILSGAATSANAAYGGLRRKVGGLVAERDAAVREAAQVREALRQAEERERARVNATRDQADEDAAKARKQMQSAVDEHLRCIRKLLAEKEGLIKKVEALQTEVAAGGNKRDAEMKRLRELHEKSLHDLRARLSASERAKRDEWSQKEAKRIKESTMKAMEPDIALLLNRHKAEKKRLEDELAAAGRKRDEAAAAAERDAAEFKSRLVREMEDAAQKERDAFRARMHEQAERAARALEDERRLAEERRAGLEKNSDEVRAALVAQVSDMARKLAEAEKREQQRQCDASAETARAVAAAQAEMAAQHRQMRGALEQERAGLAGSVQAASEQLLEARTAEIRTQCQAERDAAIARVVERLEQEQLKALADGRDAEKRWKDVTAQLQREADRLRTELECTAAHFRSAKEAVAERDERIKELTEQLVNVKHVSTADSAASEGAFERRLTALDNTWQQRTQSLQAEHVRDTAALQAEVQHLQRQAQLAKEEHDTAASVAAQKHAAELAVINERVSLTLNKKDAQVRQLADTVSSLERQVQLRDEELARHDALLE